MTPTRRQPVALLCAVLVMGACTSSDDNGDEAGPGSTTATTIWPTEDQPVTDWPPTVEGYRELPEETCDGAVSDAELLALGELPPAERRECVIAARAAHLTDGLVLVGRLAYGLLNEAMGSSALVDSEIDEDTPVEVIIIRAPTYAFEGRSPGPEVPRFDMSVMFVDPGDALDRTPGGGLTWSDRPDAQQLEELVSAHRLDDPGSE